MREWNLDQAEKIRIERNRLLIPARPAYGNRLKENDTQVFFLGPQGYQDLKDAMAEYEAEGRINDELSRYENELDAEYEAEKQKRLADKEAELRGEKPVNKPKKRSIDDPHI